MRDDQDALAFDDVEDGIVDELIGPRRLAMYALWETLHRLAWNVCMDPGPALLTKLKVLHEMTRPEYRVEPMNAVPELQRIIAENAGDLTYERHLGPALVAFRVYAEATMPRKRAARKAETPKKIAVNVQSVPGDFGF